MSERPGVFISYAHQDFEGVRKIHSRLKEAGLRPWIDEDDILPGQKWRDAVKDGIRKADFFLLCLSPQSISRRGVLQNEIRSALEVQREKLNRDIWFLPAWIQVGAPFPKEEMDDLPEEIRNIQWANLGDPSGWNKLLDAIRHQLAQSRETTKLGSLTTATAAGTSLMDAAEAQLAVLKAALKAQDSAAADVECHRLEAVLNSYDGTLPHKVLRPLLLQLSKLRWYALAGRLADACIGAGASAAYVRRCYAQALFRGGFRSAAIEMLTSARSDAAGDPTEWGQVTLDLASAHAGRYCMCTSTGAGHVRVGIVTAITLCDEVYRKDPRRNVLHGSTAAALTVRALADGIPVDCSRQPAELAQAILDEAGEREEVGVSLGSDDCAAALVAALILGDSRAAQRWVQQFLEHPETDPADIEWLSELVTHAWREDQAATIHALGQHLSIRAPQRTIEAPQSETSDRVERVVLESEFVSSEWFRAGLEAARSVACIRHEENIIATGFLVRGGDLKDEWGDELVLLANSYVIADPTIRNQLAFSVPTVQSIRVQFAADDSSHPEYGVGELLFSSPPHQLDVSVCRLEPPAIGVKALRLATRLPLRQRRVMLVGHPLGMALRLSHGTLLDHDDYRLHYSAASEAGSSGSPVFTEDWHVIGIHHAGSLQMPRLRGHPGTYPANEGISILAIIKRLARL
jgi:hypothetical protein